MYFADMHTHILCAVDDGAESAEQMQQMLDAAYACGTRKLWLTPHYHPGYFGKNREKSEEAFAKLLSYGAKYPDLELYLANELRYSPSCDEWLDQGLCRTLDGGSSVLVDFSASETVKNITEGMDRLLRAGYRPVLAHVERYRNLRGQWQILERMKDRGVRFQITAASLTGECGLRTGWFAKSIVMRNLADHVASDAHDMEYRRPEMDGAYGWIRKKCGATMAQALCWENALALMPKGKE